MDFVVSRSGGQLAHAKSKHTEHKGRYEKGREELEHLCKIDDEIIAEIRRARFLVADFTQGETGPRDVPITIPRNPHRARDTELVLLGQGERRCQVMPTL